MQPHVRSLLQCLSTLEEAIVPKCEAPLNWTMEQMQKPITYALSAFSCIMFVTSLLVWTRTGLLGLAFGFMIAGSLCSLLVATVKCGYLHGRAAHAMVVSVFIGSCALTYGGLASMPSGVFVHRSCGGGAIF